MVISTVGYEKRTGSASSASIIIQKELQPDNAIIQGKAISSVGRNVEISTGKGELTLTQEGFLQATAYLPGTQN